MSWSPPGSDDRRGRQRRAPLVLFDGAGLVNATGARDVLQHRFALVGRPVVRVRERRLLQSIQPVQRPGRCWARAAWAPADRDVDRAGGRVGVDVEDVLVAVLAPGARENPAALV